MVPPPPPSVMKLHTSDICRRRLKCEITSTYCTLTREQVDSLIPDTKPVFIICLLTYASVAMMTYHVNLEPMFFEHEEKLVPSGKGSSYAEVVFSQSGLVFIVL